MNSIDSLLDFFKEQRPTWEHAIEWDEEDRNLDRIEARVEKLEELALDQERFDGTPVTDVRDAAYEYVTKEV